MTDVVSHHGGDDGDEPPHDHATRLPTGCESSKSTNCRGYAKNLKTYAKFKKNNCKPLPVEVHDNHDMYKFVGDNSSDIIRMISQEVKKHCPFYYSGWQHVPDEYKNKIYPTLFKFFDLKAFQESEEVWKGVKLGINAECRRSYTATKSKLKRHFLENGGYENPGTAKKFPPPHVELEDWIRIIEDVFVDENYMKRCASNKSNREKLPYVSFGGSESYSQKRYMEVKNGLVPSYSNGFKPMHYKESTGWINDRARQDWEKIEEEKRKIQKESSEPYDEVVVMKRALGERRGHIRGVGRVVRKPIPEVSSSYAVDSNEQWREQMKEELTQQITQELQQQVEERMKKTQEDFQEQMKNQFEKIREEYERQGESSDDN